MEANKKHHNWFLEPWIDIMLVCCRTEAWRPWGMWWSWRWRTMSLWDPSTVWPSSSWETRCEFKTENRVPYMISLQCDGAECGSCGLNSVHWYIRSWWKGVTTIPARATNSLIIRVEAYIASVRTVCILLVLDGLARGPEASTEKLGFMLHPPSQ